MLTVTEPGSYSFTRRAESDTVRDVAHRKPRKALPRWGANIKAALRARGLTNRLVAARIGMSEQQFSDLINDPDANPEVRQLQRVADGIGVDLGDLLRADSSEGTEHYGARAISDDIATAVAGAVRLAARDLLSDILLALGPSDADRDAREPDATARDHTPAHADVDPDADRTLRRSGTR